MKRKNFIYLIIGVVALALIFNNQNFFAGSINSYGIECQETFKGNVKYSVCADGTQEAIGCIDNVQGEFLDWKCQTGTMVQKALTITYKFPYCQPIFGEQTREVFRDFCKTCPEPTPISEWKTSSITFGGQALQERLIKAYRGTACEPITITEYRSNDGGFIGSLEGATVIPIAIIVAVILIGIAFYYKRVLKK